MELRQPCEVNGFAFKRHAVRHLLGNGLPAQLLSRGGRQQLPAMNGFDVTHDRKIAANAGLSNIIHAGSGKFTRLQQKAARYYAASRVHRVHFNT